MLRREELAEEMERLHEMDPSEVPEESKFLLDFDIDDLAESDITNQEHWIIAMRAARIAGMRVRGRSVRWASLPKRRRKHRAPPSRVFTSLTVREEVLQTAFSDLLPQDTRRRPSEAVMSLLEPSNKRRKRRRKTEQTPPFIMHSSS